MVLVRATEYFARLKKDAKARPKGVLQCHECGTSLQESITGCRKLVDGSHLCSDCYFEKLGNALEKYPIITPRARRA
jgi:hypothetical protein